MAALPTTDEQDRLLALWVTSSRDGELDAWNRAYDSRFPRPDGSSAATVNPHAIC